jgi:serine phosphatase RsbU (regulator of sigma subunit)/CHASE3 domain sensor protein
VRLSLRWKIVGGYGLLLTLIALLGWVTLSQVGSLRSVQREVFDDAIPALEAVDEIVRSYTAQSNAVNRYLNSSQPALLDQYRSEVEIAIFWQNQARRLFTEGEERALLEDLIAAGRSWQRLVDEQVIPLVADGDRTAAFRVLGQEGTPLITEIETEGGVLRSTQAATVERTEEDLRGKSNQTLIALVGVTIMALVSGLALAIALPRRLVGGLSRLVDATRAVERGDFDQPLEIRSGDEVEELAERFGEMKEGLKRLQQLALQDRELEIAASIQRNLLQRTLPESPTFRLVPLHRQANLVGGDWYDVDLTGRSLTIVVGDASGKGIAAALMATVALSFLRAERGLGAGPKRIVERTNEALREATDPDSFTTLLYATLELHSGEVRWLNMGHPSPFVLRSRADGGPTGYYLEGPRNRALGWFDDPGLTETVVHLHPGDRLVVFTDGWLEAKSADGEVFGEHRFAESLMRLAPLGGEDLVQELVGDVERFAAGKLDDDLTMLIIEFLGAALPSPEEQGYGEQTGEDTWHSRR